MFGSDRPYNGRRIATAAMLLVFLVSACTTGASQRPSPSPSPTPSPSASPSPSPSPSPDVAALFVAHLRATSKESMAIDGQLEFGGTALAIAGRYDVSGSDSHSTMTMTAGDTKQTIETESWAGKSYKRTGQAPWYEVTATAQPSSSAQPSGSSSPGQDLGSVMTSIVSARDMGIETKDGQQLHRLTAPGDGLDPKLVGFDGAGTVKLDFFAKDDGTPVVMEFTLDMIQGTTQAPTQVSGTLDFTFMPGVDPVITAPDPLFVLFTSSKGYAFGRPADWDARSENGWEDFDGPNAETVGVYAAPKGTNTVTSLAAGDVLDLKSQLKATIQSNVAATLGGEPARMVTYTYKESGGEDLVGYDVVTIHGATAVFLSWQSVAGNEEADATTFGYIADSFTFGK